MMPASVTRRWQCRDLRFEIEIPEALPDRVEAMGGGAPANNTVTVSFGSRQWTSQSLFC